MARKEQTSPRLISQRWLVLAALCAAGILGSLESRGAPTDPQPSIEPAIQLERVIATSRDLGRGRLLRRITGRPEVQLFRRPYGVAWDGEDLLITDPGAGSVLRIDPRGRTARSPTDLFSSPIGIASCEDGIVVTDSVAGKVVLLGSDLRAKREIAGGLDRPTGVACEGARIFVVETGRHHVVAIEPDRSTRTVGRRGGGQGEFNFPTVVATTREALWVGDTLNFRLQRFALEGGGFLGAFGRLGDAPGEMPRLKGLAVDPGGNLWLSDAHLDQVALFRPDGAFLMALPGNGSPDGGFSFPAGIATHPDGRVAIVDSLNRRLQILRLVDTPENGGAT